MFTGLIQSLGTVAGVGSDSLQVRVDPTFTQEALAAGESIAVNGVCLTYLASNQPDLLTFDVSPETFARTCLCQLRPGWRVNLERAMQASSRFGGHIVQGHVDTTGELVSIRQEGEFSVYRFAAPVSYGRYLIDKGSVAVDGISLTVVEPVDGQFDVWLVPHTLSHTNLSELRAGMSVNLEFDLVAKYVEKLVASATKAS
ncbi:MAG TPA: riboflavin synthase [Fimbriimonas sp.]|nr:riboflavin synthase [Fimbriimonas sp.]